MEELRKCPFYPIHHPEDRANYWIQVDPATVEQFIGLTDKYTKKMIFCLRGRDL
jgi:hypothetical protein